jgi:hypothetical protein
MAMHDLKVSLLLRATMSQESSRPQVIRYVSAALPLWQDSCPSVLIPKLDPSSASNQWCRLSVNSLVASAPSRAAELAVMTQLRTRTKEAKTSWARGHSLEHDLARVPSR